MTFLEGPPLAFAHRGGGAAGDENTAAAFERAVKLGFRYVETDVHATADGVPVVFHDATLARLTGRRGRVRTLTAADLATVRIAGAAAIPRLDEILYAWPDIRFNIDVKSDAAVLPTLAAVRSARAAGRVLLASFSDARLTRIRALAGPSLPTSLGRAAVTRLKLASLTAGHRPPSPEPTGPPSARSGSSGRAGRHPGRAPAAPGASPPESRRSPE